MCYFTLSYILGHYAILARNSLTKQMNMSVSAYITQDSQKNENLHKNDSADTKTIQLEEDSLRIDECVARVLNISRSKAQDLIKSGRVFLEKNLCQKCSTKITCNSTLHIILKTQQEANTNKDLPLDLTIERLYEDNEILILNKPPFLVIHSAPSVKEATLVDWLRAQNIFLSTLNGEQRPGIIHRLDKQTSGAIVVAKTNRAHIYLSEELKARRMGRYYLALIDMPLKEPKIVTSYLARHPNNRLKMANIDTIKTNLNSARFAKSAFIPLLTTNSTSLIAAKLYTGRTHQIRAHLEGINRHIIGDTLYGYRGGLSMRIMLHSYILYLTHPNTKKPLVFRASIFGDMLQFCYETFGKEEFNEAISMARILKAFDSFSIDE